MTVEAPAPAVSGPLFPATPYVYFQGGLVRQEDAALTLGTQALNYGTGVFEGIRGYWDEGRSSLLVVKLREHFARFLASAKVLRLDVTESVDELVAATEELLRRNGHRGDTYIRPIAFKLRLLPGTGFGVKLRGLSTAVAIYALPMPSGRLSGGVRCLVSSWRRVPDASIPSGAKITGSYANIALAVDEAQQAGCDDAILLNTRGTVAEASTANVFLRKNGVLLTPPTSADILAGITRDCVLELAAAAGEPVVEREIARSELYSADEVFLTGTGCELVPVLSIDDRVIGDGTPGPATDSYAGRYRAAVSGRDENFASWLTSVPFHD